MTSIASKTSTSAQKIAAPTLRGINIDISNTNTNTNTNTNNVNINVGGSGNNAKCIGECYTKYGECYEKCSEDYSKCYYRCGSSKAEGYSYSDPELHIL